MESSEAKNSITFTAISPEGFDVMVTHRNDHLESFFADITSFEQKLKSLGYQKKPVRSFGRPGGASKPAQKPIDLVPGRICPLCKSQLVYFEAKGKKHIKCSTAKWNPVTRQSEGCSFVEWQSERETTIDDFPNNNY